MTKIELGTYYQIIFVIVQRRTEIRNPPRSQHVHYTLLHKGIERFSCLKGSFAYFSLVVWLASCNLAASSP